MNTEIKITNVQKKYGNKTALNEINLTITQGMFGLLGRNGAGKTTLMKMIATLLKPTAGQIVVCDIPVENTAKIRPLIGYLPQDFSMYGSMSAYDALDYIGVLSGMSRQERKSTIPELLQKVNLQNNRKTKVRAMSGGMKRRLGIAQAIMHNPKVLIVDEPTAGLDPEERIRFRNLLCEIAEDRIVILSTHIAGDIEATCENLAVLDEGDILFKGTVMELLQAAKGNCYSATISRVELNKVKEQYMVTSMLMQGNQATIRIICKNGQQPFEGALFCEPSVEDAYMYLMSEKRGGI